MFCPSCKDEFRPGFTRCAACGVDLVEDLASPGKSAAVPRPAPASPSASHGPLADYCGFLALDEAQEARRRLRAIGIRTELVVRDAPGAPEGEEYWLRVEQARLADVTRELGYHTTEDTAESGEFRCDECGATVPADAAACPGCGLRFEDPT